MWNTFKYTLKALTREKQIIIWVVVFPLFLSTIFFFMFSNMDKPFTITPIPTAVVRDANYSKAPGFADMIESLSGAGKGQTLKVRSVKTFADARKLLDAGKVAGALSVDAKGAPRLSVPSGVGSQATNLNQTVLKNILDNYLRATATLHTIGQKNPAALRDPALVASLFTQKDFARPLAITAHRSKSDIRYYYTLFGFLALMASNIALTAIINAQPNLSDLGARRMVGGLSRARTLAATFAASWLLSLTGLLISYAYMRLILRIDFGGGDLVCILAFMVAALMATSLGTLIGALPKLAGGAKGGILMGLTSLMSLFAGLYGVPSMDLADRVVRAAPAARLINPVRQVSDLFYSLYYYDGYARFISGIGALLVTSAVFFTCALLLIRSHRYANI